MRALPSAPTVGVHKFKIWGQIPVTLHRPPDGEKFHAAHCSCMLTYPSWTNLHVKFWKLLTSSFREKGGAYTGDTSCGSTWRVLTKSLFSTRRTMKNDVGMKSISTSGPELWGFVLSGSGPHCKKWGTCPRTETGQSVLRQVVNSVLKFEARKTSRFWENWLWSFAPLNYSRYSPSEKFLYFESGVTNGVVR